MHWRRTFGLLLLGLSLATAAAAADSAALADAAEHRDWAGVRTLLARILLHLGARAGKPAKTHHQQAFHPKRLQWKH